VNHSKEENIRLIKNQFNMLTLLIKVIFDIQLINQK